ncbi:MAG: transcriptional regulator [Gammaproteobacteria bacterium]|nr:MAG: transcriptional regulator [Gammaproteobacteria bacterium]
MHIPLKFKQTDQQSLYQLIKDYPLGTLVISSDNAIDADHIPFYLNNSSPEKLTLQSHIAKANPLWQNYSDGQKILIIFHGPNAYISPNLYPSKKESGHAVPTWNYSVVHVKGRINFKHDSQWIFQFLDKITNLQEAESQPKPWSISDAPEEYTQKLIKAVVGIEVEIEGIIGKFKLSQNKSNHDYNAVLNTLAASTKESEVLMSKQMENIRSTPPK